MSRQTDPQGPSYVAPGGNYIKGNGSPFNGNMQRFTATVWVKPSDLSAFPDIFGFTSGVETSTTRTFLVIAGDNDDTGISVSMLYSNGTHETNFGVPPGTGFFATDTWVHMAFSFDWSVGGSVKVYKNGVPQTTYIFGFNAVPIPPGTPPNNDSSYAWWLGVIDGRPFIQLGQPGSGDVPDFVFPGLFADFRVYNVVLSDADIAAVYAGGTPQPNALVTRWKLCANENGVIDSSGQGNNGVFVGTCPTSLDDPPGLSCVTPPPDSYIGVNSEFQKQLIKNVGF